MREWKEREIWLVRYIEERTREYKRIREERTGRERIEKGWIREDMIREESRIEQRGEERVDEKPVADEWIREEKI